MRKDYELMSNAEIRVKIKEYENEYEAIKVKIKNNLDRMEELDKRFLEAKEVLSSRIKNMV